MKKWISQTLITVIIYNMIMFMLFAFLAHNIIYLLSSLQGKIDIFEAQRHAQVLEIKKAVIETMKITIDNDEKQIEMIKDVSKLTKYVTEMSITNDEKQLKLIEDIIKNVKTLKAKVTLMERKLQASKSIDLKNVEKYKKANLLIYNATSNFSGSGTHIKIKNKDYILTASHLIENPDDFIWGILDNGDWHPLELTKINKEKDLILFRVFGLECHPYLEISDESPKEGSKIIVIGNPDDMKDVITDGIISKVGRKGYLFTNIIYFGNSGGAILYKGKIIGVVSEFRCYFQIPIFVNYGFGCKLEMIKDFLEDVNE